jgi:hypothetical protein
VPPKQIVVVPMSPADTGVFETTAASETLGTSRVTS